MKRFLIVFSFSCGVIFSARALAASAASMVQNAEQKAFQNKLDKWVQSSGPVAKKMNRFYEIYWEHLMLTSPEWATYQGFPGQNDRWTDRSLAQTERQKNDVRTVLKFLSSVSEKGLKGEDLMNYRLLRFRLEQAVEEFQFPEEYLAVDQMGGIHSEIPSLMANAPKRNLKDYNDMIARLRGSVQAIEQTISVLREGLAQQVTQPKVTLAGVPQQFDKLMTERVEESPIYKPFMEISKDVLSAEKALDIQKQAKEVLIKEVYPALGKMKNFMVTEYIPGCRESIGMSNLPNGKNWYNARIKNFTTVDLTADEIFELGNREVKRIRGEMDKVREQLKFNGDFKKFNESLKDAKFYYTNGDDLLNRFRAIGKTIDPELPKFFGTLPRNTYGISEMPPFKAPSSPAAYYESGSLQAGRAGQFVANTYDLKARPKWAMIDLTCHEAVPGHHFQISVAQELQNLPEFRRNMHYTAYVEGWGLYAEGVCEDMGLYKDLYDRYGMLTADMWRAVRLVVDTGIHSKGWTRDQAMNFFREAGPFAEQEIQAETNRYIVWAGQALAYKIGQLKILELREKTKLELGERFDIRRFHDQILGSGALPLKVLEKKLTDWTQAEKVKK